MVLKLTFGFLLSLYQGVAVVDGMLIENLHVESAQRLVGMAETIEALEAEQANAD
jgi:hypothetical protein